MVLGLHLARWLEMIFLAGRIIQDIVNWDTLVCELESTA